MGIDTYNPLMSAQRSRKKLKAMYRPRGLEATRLKTAAPSCLRMPEPGFKVHSSILPMIQAWLEQDMADRSDAFSAATLVSL